VSAAEIGRQLGLSSMTMSRMKARGCPMGSVEEVVAWREKQRSNSTYVQSAPRAPALQPGDVERGDPSEPLNLAQERAALARAQREALETKLAIQRGEYANITLLADVLATASQAVAERMDTLPGHLAKVCPHLSSADRAQIVTVLNDARQEWVRATANIVADRLASLDVESATPQ
jgi:phage terminase Nu1 subunit (DNA packaging protein)